MEQKTELKVYETQYVCDHCGKAIMTLIQGVELNTTPPKYLHQCSSCNIQALYDKKYPIITHEYVQEKKPKSNPIPKQSELKS